MAQEPITPSLAQSPQDWNLQRFLSTWELAQHCDGLTNAGFNTPVALVTMKQEDMIRAGILKLGECKRLERAIRELPEWKAEDVSIIAVFNSFGLQSHSHWVSLHSLVLMDPRLSTRSFKWLLGDADEESEKLMTPLFSIVTEVEK